MLKFAIPLQQETTTRQQPVGKEKAMRKLPNVEVSYVTFSEHIKRDFADPVTAALFHNKGDCRMGSVERPAGFFQTVAARDPAWFNVNRVFFRDKHSFNIGCIAKISFDEATVFEARLFSTFMAPDGCVTTSASTNAPERTLRVGNSLALFEALPGVMPPERWAFCFTEERRVTLRFTRSGGGCVIAVRESIEHEKDSWSALTAASPLELSHVPQPCEDNLSEKDP